MLLNVKCDFDVSVSNDVAIYVTNNVLSSQATHGSPQPHFYQNEIGVFSLYIEIK